MSQSSSRHRIATWHRRARGHDEHACRPAKIATILSRVEKRLVAEHMQRPQLDSSLSVRSSAVPSCGWTWPRQCVQTTATAGQRDGGSRVLPISPSAGPRVVRASSTEGREEVMGGVGTRVETGALGMIACGTSTATCYVIRGCDARTFERVQALRNMNMNM